MSAISLCNYVKRAVDDHADESKIFYPLIESLFLNLVIETEWYIAMNKMLHEQGHTLLLFCQPRGAQC